MAKSQATLDIGTGGVVDVRVMYASSLSNIPVKFLMGPDLEGFEVLPKMPSLSFLIEHPSGRRVLFDLGIRKDWKTGLPESVSQRLVKSNYKVEAEKNVYDVLTDNGLNADEIEAVIWSHWHWDHTGDMTQFPPSTQLVVGQGFTEAFVTNAKSQKKNHLGVVSESDYQGRHLREIDFKDVTKRIGPFPAFDFFGDGSFYLLDTPGHAIGHLCGFARTTAQPDSFVFLGGDIAHHGAEFRPSHHRPVPTSLCPAEIISHVQESRKRKNGQPLFDPNMGHEIPLAIKTLEQLQEIDVLTNVFIVIAHDPTVAEVIRYFPESIDDWQKQDWASKTRWVFVISSKHFDVSNRNGSVENCIDPNLRNFVQIQNPANPKPAELEKGDA